MNKKPWLAVLLNLVPPPFSPGYLYLGLWRRWAKVLLVCVAFWIVTGTTQLWWDTSLLFFGIWFYVVVDVHEQAGVVNETAAPDDHQTEATEIRPRA